MDPYQHQPFPSVRYHRDGTTRTVEHERDEMQAAKEGYTADTPAAFLADEPAVSNPGPASTVEPVVATAAVAADAALTPQQKAAATKAANAAAKAGAK